LSLKKGLEEMRDEFGEAIQKDLGKGKFYSYLTEVAFSQNEIQHCVDHLKTWMKREYVDTPLLVGPGSSYIDPEPLGVVLVLGTWNYPIGTALNPMISAMAAGNCILVKPADMCPNHSPVFAKLITKYLDPRFYKVIEGKLEVSRTLTTMRFDMIAFTGSTQTGKLVGKAAAANLVPVLLELGGKSPSIIDDSADAEYAAKKILCGKMPNLGQICIATDYIMCHESKYE